MSPPITPGSGAGNGFLKYHGPSQFRGAPVKSHLSVDAYRTGAGGTGFIPNRNQDLLSKKQGESAINGTEI